MITAPSCNGVPGVKIVWSMARRDAYSLSATRVRVLIEAHILLQNDDRPCLLSGELFHAVHNLVDELIFRHRVHDAQQSALTQTGERRPEFRLKHNERRDHTVL